MLRIIKLLFFLGVLGLVALTAFAFLGDMSPERHEIEQPVTLKPV